MTFVSVQLKVWAWEGLPFGASNWAWEACDDAGGTRVFESASGGKTPVELEKIHYENT